MESTLPGNGLVSQAEAANQRTLRTKSVLSLSFVRLSAETLVFPLSFLFNQTTCAVWIRNQWKAKSTGSTFLLTICTVRRRTSQPSLPSGTNSCIRSMGRISTQTRFEDQTSHGSEGNRQRLAISVEPRPHSKETQSWNC